MSAISGFCEKCNKFRKRHCDGNRNTCMSILFDTIEALQQENEQLNADVEALRKAIGEKEDVKKAGYRKQSETVKEFAERLIKRLTKEVKDNPEAAASQYKAGLYFAMDLAAEYGKEVEE